MALARTLLVDRFRVKNVHVESTKLTTEEPGAKTVVWGYLQYRMAPCPSEIVVPKVGIYSLRLIQIHLEWGFLSILPCTFFSQLLVLLGISLMFWNTSACLAQLGRISRPLVSTFVTHAQSVHPQILWGLQISPIVKVRYIIRDAFLFHLHKS